MKTPIAKLLLWVLLVETPCVFSGSGSNSKIHLKIQVPELVNNHHHTKTVYLHVHDKTPSPPRKHEHHHKHNHVHHGIGGGKSHGGHGHFHHTHHMHHSTHHTHDHGHGHHHGHGRVGHGGHMIPRVPKVHKHHGHKHPKNHGHKHHKHHGHKHRGNKHPKHPIHSHKHHGHGPKHPKPPSHPSNHKPSHLDSGLGLGYYSTVGHDDDPSLEFHKQKLKVWSYHNNNDEPMSGQIYQIESVKPQYEAYISHDANLPPVAFVPIADPYAHLQNTVHAYGLRNNPTAPPNPQLMRDTTDPHSAAFLKSYHSDPLANPYLNQGHESESEIHNGAQNEFNDYDSHRHHEDYHADEPRDSYGHTIDAHFPDHNSFSNHKDYSNDYTYPPLSNTITNTYRGRGSAETEALLKGEYDRYMDSEKQIKKDYNINTPSFPDASIESGIDSYEEAFKNSDDKTLDYQYDEYKSGDTDHGPDEGFGSHH